MSVTSLMVHHQTPEIIHCQKVQQTQTNNRLSLGGSDQDRSGNFCVASLRSTQQNGQHMQAQRYTLQAKTNEDVYPSVKTLPWVWGAWHSHAWGWFVAVSLMSSGRVSPWCWQGAESMTKSGQDSNRTQTMTAAKNAQSKWLPITTAPKHRHDQNGTQ